jgi:hypothetical protein
MFSTVAVIIGASLSFLNKEVMEATETETNHYAEQFIKSQGVCLNQNVHFILVN